MPTKLVAFSVSVGLLFNLYCINAFGINCTPLIYPLNILPIESERRQKVCVMFHRAKNLAFNSNCPQAEKTQGFASMLVLIAVLATINLISAEQRDVTRLDDATLRRQDSTLIDRQGGYSPFKRWEIDEETESDNSIIIRPQRHQGEYKCGRAIATGNKDPLFSKEQQVSRVKYRPLEIRMPRIIGGEETQPGEFPWTVSVKLNGQPICGGSLIEKSWILTAAHCVVGYNPKNLTVRLGAFRIKDMRETQTVDLSVSMFIVHKDYSIPRPFSNDIALLKMIEPVDFTDFIIPICLPNEDMARSPTDHSATASESTAFSKRPVVVVAADGDEEAGIVVSTKMSDNDIAKCFSRLEQNYLSSIGMGASAETATSSERPSPGLAVAQRSTTSTTSAPMPSYLFSHGSPSDAVYMTNDDRELASESVHQTFAHSSKPMGPYFGSESNSLDVYNPSSYVYQHAYHWNRKQSPVKIPDGGSSPRRNPIKLSRLPISKELLREIQSVGSGAMPTLSLGIQQGDFVAMASDLTQSSANKDRVSNFANRNQLSGSSSMQLEDMDDPGKYSGLSGIVVGWGWVRELDGEDQVNNKGYPSVELQKVKLPILRNNVCEAWFQSQAKKITLLPSQFCAGFSSGGKDACRGDSGGPMVIEDNSDIGRYKLIGIVSAGIGCARPSLPGLYTRVASFIPWINAQMVRY